MDALMTVYSWITNIIEVWAWMLKYQYALGTRTLFWLGHGCSDDRMLLEYDRFYGLGMDALIIVCSWGTTRILLGTGHSCSDDHMFWEHERYYVLGMDALRRMLLE